MKHGIGERILPGDGKGHPFESLLYKRHLFAYEQAQEFVSGKKILEIGCGLAYGTKLLAETASEVYALDTDSQLIHELVKNNPQNIQYTSYDGRKMPYDDGFFDVIVFFQVIEHVADDVAFLKGVKRLLKPSGKAILKTPNRFKESFRSSRF